MDQIKRVPKVISSVKEIQNPQINGSQILRLKQEINHFIHDIKREFSIITTAYQKKLFDLQSCSINLKNSRQNTKTVHSENNEFKIGYINNTNKPSNQIEYLPLKSKGFYRTATSQFQREQGKQSIGFRSWASTIRKKKSSPIRVQQIKDFETSTEFMEDQFQKSKSFHKSRYQRLSQQKRQEQQAIIDSLQSHQKNLNLITSQMMNLLGKKSKKLNEEIYDQQSSSQQEIQIKSKQIQGLNNESLTQVCDFLQKSFVSQKARKDRIRSKNIILQEKKNRMQQSIKNEKIVKQRALKNLLKNLRENAKSSSPTEVIKGSRLNFSDNKNCNVEKNERQINVVGRNCKVKINPVPVKQSRVRQQIPNHVQRRPTSILKQYSSILTRSISGISAISMEE